MEKKNTFQLMLKMYERGGMIDKPIRMTKRLAIALEKIADIIMDHTPEDGDYEAICEARLWILHQVNKRYSRSELIEHGMNTPKEKRIKPFKKPR